MAEGYLRDKSGARSRQVSSSKDMYNETFYPRADDSASDMESEYSVESVSSEDFTSVEMEGSTERQFATEGMDFSADHDHDSPTVTEDFTCAICAQMLVDPLTLHCGHSFCQLCLASMWAAKQKPSPMRLECPVCRQPWRNLPGVNIQLRNIIEHTYQKAVESRKSVLTEGDQQLLKQFLSAKEAESEVNRVEVRRVPPEMRGVVQALFIFFAVVITLLVIMFCLVLWVWAGAGGEFMRKPVTKWNSEDVSEWVLGLGDWAKNYSVIFKKERITGQRLLQLNDEALGIIGVRGDYRRQTIIQAVEELRLTEYSMPRNFHEFKAAQRKQTLLIAAFYKMWPRLTFVYIYFVNYYDIILPLVQSQFPGGGAGEATTVWRTGEELSYESEDLSEPTYRQLLAFAVEILLIPHFIVAWYTWSWWDVHPWIAFAVILHCAWAMLREGQAVVQAAGKSGNWRVNWRAKIPGFLRTAVRKTFQQYLRFVFFFLVATVIWHLIPHFICDILFYLILWHTLYMHIVIATVLRVIRVRVQLMQLQGALQQPVM